MTVIEKRCPFCGGADLSVDLDIESVVCATCTCTGPSVLQMEHENEEAVIDSAIDHWELRTQYRVATWVLKVFDVKTAHDGNERVLRFLEEALELAQTVDIDVTMVHRLVDYVFARPVGKQGQEIGGCLVTLYAAAVALGGDADACFEEEFDRIQASEVIERIRSRQAEKREALRNVRENITPNCMDAPDGPACHCGRPSTQESGWCGVCDLSF